MSFEETKKRMQEKVAPQEPRMFIIEATPGDLWITAIIAGRWCQAKVYQEPSTFGIGDGMVSKLAVAKGPKRDPNRNFFEQLDFNYDRGLDFDNLPEGVLDKIVSELEAYRHDHPYC